MFTLNVERTDNFAVLRCSGRITRGHGADALLWAVTAEDKCHIVVDLGGVTTIDAAGLGVLAQAERLARDSNRTLQVVNASKHVHKVLEITGLSSVVRVVSALAAVYRAA